MLAGVLAMTTALAPAGAGQDGNAAAPVGATTRPAPSPDGIAPVAVVTAEEIVVTASRREMLLRELPASAVVVREPSSAKPAAKNFLDLFADEPGVKVNRRQDNGIFGAGLEIRGLNTNAVSGGNVLVLLDGIPQRRLSFGGPYMGAIPMDAVTRVELIKGPMSVQYGRGALAGAMQLFTDSGDEEYGGKTQITYDSASKNIRSWLRFFGPVEGMAGSTFSLTASGGYAEGWQERTESGRGYLYWHGRFVLSRRDELGLVAGYYKGCENVAAPLLIDEEGNRLPGIDRDTNLGVPGQNGIQLREYRAGATWTHRYEETFLHKLTAAYWNGDTVWHVGRPSDAPAAGTVVSRRAGDQHFEEESWFTELQFQKFYELGTCATGSLTFGGTLEYQKYDNSNRPLRTTTSTFSQGIPLDLATMAEPDKSTWVYGDTTRRETREWDWSAFISNQTTFFERLTVEAGARFDSYRRTQVNLSNGNRSAVRDSAISPGVGLSYRLCGEPDARDHLTGYASYGRGFFPVFRGVSSTEILELSPETSESYEAGLKAAAFDGRLSTTVAAYCMQRKDVVGYNAATATQENMGDWDIKGVEFDVRARPADWLDLRGSYTYRCPRIDRHDSNPAYEGNHVVFVSDQMFKIGAELNHQRKLFVGSDVVWTGQCHADEANRITLPAHCEVNAHVAYKWDHCKVTFFVRNLFDQEYYSGVFNGVVNGSAFPGEPRTFGVTFAAEF